MERELYIGLMSGTSLDGIDAILVDFSSTPLTQITAQTHPIPVDVTNELLALNLPGDNEIDRLGKMDFILGELFAEAVLNLLSTANIDAGEIKAIGSHGQTIRHRPNGDTPFSLQIGNPSLIAERTGIITVADFRSRDIAAGGQGAPLVPAFHSGVFSDPHINRCIVNIGGIANVTILPANQSAPIQGFDTGPGNALMNSWCHKHHNKPFDDDGLWAAIGQINNELLNKLLRDDYFTIIPPKSSGREYFNLPWLIEKLGTTNTISNEDIQATLCELTAATIQMAIDEYAPGCEEVFICGGGIHNQTLMTRLTEHLATKKVASTNEIGLHPDWVEAAAFAWLAHQTLRNLPGNLPSVTGAHHPVILGGIYPGCVI